MKPVEIECMAAIIVSGLIILFLLYQIFTETRDSSAVIFVLRRGFTLGLILLIIARGVPMNSTVGLIIAQFCSDSSVTVFYGNAIYSVYIFVLLLFSFRIYF